MKASKKRRPFVVALAVTAARILLVNASPVTAQTNVTASAEATIVEGISVQKISDIDFGSLIASAEGGTVTINATSGQVSCSGVQHVHNSTCRLAQFKTNGEENYRYTIALPKSIRLEHEKGKGSITATDFTYSQGAGTINGRGNGGGEQTFGIGATLRIGPNQPTGRYQGTFEVSIQHQ